MASFAGATPKLGLGVSSDKALPDTLHPQNKFGGGTQRAESISDFAKIELGVLLLLLGLLLVLLQAAQPAW